MWNEHDRDGQDPAAGSEERLNVGTEQVETGHVRLRKYVVTEEQQVTVPAERARPRTETVTDDDRKHRRS